MTPATFFDYLHRVGIWAYDAGVFRFYLHASHATHLPSPVIPVPDTTLRDIHPELPLRVKALFERYQDTFLSFGLTEDLRATIAHLLHPYPVLTLQGATAFLLEVETIHCDEKSDTVTIAGLTYHITETTPPCVRIVCANPITASLRWMNTTYPGWQLRAETAQALGYTGEALLHYALTAPEKPHPAVNLDAVSLTELPQ